MIRKMFFAFCYVATLLTLAAVPAHADCEDEIKEVHDDIDKNKDDYTKDAISEARKHLRQAEIPSLKLADCQREVREAKKALRQGKK